MQGGPRELVGSLQLRRSRKAAKKSGELDDQDLRERIEASPGFRACHVVVVFRRWPFSITTHNLHRLGLEVADEDDQDCAIGRRSREQLLPRRFRQ